MSCEFNYFRWISDIALDAGAFVDDVERMNIRLPFVDGVMIHGLADYILGSNLSLFNKAKIVKFQYVIAYFVKIGFDIEYWDSFSQTPFLDAAKCHSPSAIKFLQTLLEHNINSIAKDDGGRGALHLAIENYGSEDVCIDCDESGSLEPIAEFESDSRTDTNSDGDIDLELERSISMESESSFDLDSADSTKVVEARRNRDGTVSVEQYPRTVVSGWSKPKPQFLRDELLFLLQAGCDP